MSSSCIEDNGCISNFVRENMIAMSMMTGKGRCLRIKVIYRARLSKRVMGIQLQ